jgi:hypothetical protein
MTEPDATRTWLRDAAAPGRMPLRLAGAAQALETLFTVGVWAALAWLAQSALAHRAHPTALQLALLLANGLLAGAAVWSAAHFQAAGRRSIGSSIRQQLVDACCRGDCGKPSRTRQRPQQQRSNWPTRSPTTTRRCSPSAYPPPRRWRPSSSPPP